MFFLFPIGHDELTLRGLPFATFGLMALCTVVFFLTIGTMAADEARERARVEAAPRPSAEGVRLDETGEVIEPTRAPRAESEPRPEPRRADTLARRWGWVPASPGVGIVTHVFLHAGIVQLVLTLIFLWTAGVRLEELWSRPVFVGGFVLFGILSALVYGAVATDPAEPLLGAAGAVAGLMGAMAVRAGRSKIYFAYFIWLGLKPRMGTFDAPAYIMPPIWLVTQLGVQFLGMAMGLSVRGASYTQWMAGFALGAAAALAMKKLRFEERVLKRAPETRIDPEDMPLVAFQRAERPGQRPSAGSGALEAIAATLVGFDRTALRFETPSGAALEIAAPEVRAWAAGRVNRIDPSDAALLGVDAPPRAPAILLAFVVAPRSPGTAARAIVVDAALLKYARLLDGPASSPKEAFFRLVARVNTALPGAAFAGDRGRVHTGSLPEFDALRSFIQRLEEAVAVLKPSARP